VRTAQVFTVSTVLGSTEGERWQAGPRFSPRDDKSRHAHWEMAISRHLSLPLQLRHLGYEKLREIDEVSKNAKAFDTNVLLEAGESVPEVYH